MRIAVVTVVAGRHGHLALQRAGLMAGGRAPDLHVIVGMGEPVAPDVRATGLLALQVPVVAGRLPLAGARNVGAAAALRDDADLVVFLDVDCVPGDRLVSRYAEVADALPRSLLCGPVAYLPPPPPAGYQLDMLPGLATPHPARPHPAEGGCQRQGDHTLFWSLSFAVTAQTWSTLGGFCEDYTGYGGEDTDYGQLAAAAGVELCWVGGAYAFHQHHPNADPPIQHLDDILRNAGVFHRRWGWWPMRGWLSAFEREGLIELRSGRWRRVDAGPELCTAAITVGTS